MDAVVNPADRFQFFASSRPTFVWDSCIVRKTSYASKR
jgi:hypothetical protein